MANETTYADNTTTIAAAAAAAILGPFMEASIMHSLVGAYTPGAPNTNTLRIPKSGAAPTFATVNEAAAITPATLTDTYAELTIIKIGAALRVTAEALKFAGGGTARERHARLLGLGAAKKFDQDCLALAAGFSQSVDAGASMTVAKLQEAAYLIRTGNLQDTSNEIDAILSSMQWWQIGEDIRTSGNAVYGNPNFVFEQVADGKKPNGGYRGKIYGINAWETNNVYIDTGATPDDFVGIVQARGLAIAALYPNGHSAPEFEFSESDHQEFLNSNTLRKGLSWYDVGELVDAAGIGVKSNAA